MPFNFWLVCTCLGALLLTEAQSRSIDREEQSLGDRVHRVVRDVASSLIAPQTESATLTRVQRSQVLLIENKCVSNTSCVDSKFGTNVPSDLVHCNADSGLCVCSQCFVRIDNTCEVIAPLCRNYSLDTMQCVENRKSQELTFLLSVFLSSVGAANFYIGDYVLGGVQLGLLVAAIIISVACICLPLIAIMCVEEEDDDYDWGECCVTASAVTGLVLVVILVFAIACWWAADLAIFAYNGRTDLNGCPLIADL